MFLILILFKLLIFFYPIASSAPGFISGEKMSNGKVRTLSALYRPTFEKLPTFPSIYKTKYQNDFKYIPFPVSSNFK